MSDWFNAITSILKSPAVQLNKSLIYCTSPFGQQSEGHSMIHVGGTYFWMASGYTGWQPNQNMYVAFAGSSPIGATWGAPANAFQASADANALGLAGTQHGVTQGNVQTIAYDTQSNQLVTILGRTNGVFYLGDRYDNTLTGAAAGTSTSANFQAYRMIMLPVTFPTSTTMSIVWSSSWDFDTAMPTTSGQPAVPAGLGASGGFFAPLLRWSNPETKAHMLYVDRADDAGFTLNVVSDLVPQGTAEYTDVTLAAGAKPFYRIRAVNASGSSVSGIVVPTAGNVFGGGRHPSGYRGGYRGGGRDDDRMRHKF